MRKPNAGPGKANWLSAMGAKQGRMKIKRAPATGPEAAGLAADTKALGIQVSQASGKVTFPVLYKFHEGYTNAVKRALCMADICKPASKRC